MFTTGKSTIARIIAGVFYILSAAGSVGVALLIQRTIDSVATGEVSILVTSIVMLLGIELTSFVVTMLAITFRLTYAKEMLLVSKRHRLNFLFKKRQQSPAETDSNNLSFFTTDADILNESYFSNKARLPLYFAEFIFAMAALIWINWIVTVVLIGVTMLPILGTGLFAKGMQRRKKAYSDAAAGYVETVRECLDGKKEIVAFDRQDVFLARHHAANINIENARFKSAWFEVFANNVTNHLGSLTFITAIALGSYFVIIGNMTFGAMIAIVQLLNSVMSPINSLSQVINGIRSSKEIVAKAMESHGEEEVKTKIDGFTHSLEIKNLGVAYSEDEYALQGMNLSFKKGGKYAIFAPSGYGKSSIARAIALEFTQFDGSITIDGKEIREIDEQSYNKVLRYVRQDPYVFNDTAAQNLTFFEQEHSKENFDRVMELTRVKEFLPTAQDLERNISNTSGLSGGQKQRIVLARALLYAPKILVLDEITAGIDLETAYNILQDLFKDTELTCIVITHESDKRFQGLFDEVIKLENVKAETAA